MGKIHAEGGNGRAADKNIAKGLIVSGR